MNVMITNNKNIARFVKSVLKTNNFTQGFFSFTNIYTFIPFSHLSCFAIIHHRETIIHLIGLFDANYFTPFKQLA